MPRVLKIKRSKRKSSIREPSILVHRRDPKATIPTRVSDKTVGYDLYASKQVDIESGSSIPVSTGFEFEIPQGYFGQIVKRRRLTVKQYEAEGCIMDSTFTGELNLIIRNTGTEPIRIEIGESIARLLIQRDYNLPIVEVYDEEKHGSDGEDHVAKPRCGRSKQVRPVECPVTISYGPVTKEAAEDWRRTTKGGTRAPTS